MGVMGVCAAPTRGVGIGPMLIIFKDRPPRQWGAVLALANGGPYEFDMFPLFKHRLMLGSAAVLGCFIHLYVWQMAVGSFEVARFSPLNTSSPGAAVAAIVIATLLVLLPAALVAAAGNPHMGAFIISASLLLGAVKGGSIDRWILDTASAAGWWRLAMEAGIWLLIVGGGIWLCRCLRAPLRKLLPLGLVHQLEHYELPELSAARPAASSAAQPGVPGSHAVHVNVVPLVTLLTILVAVLADQLVSTYGAKALGGGRLSFTWRLIGVGLIAFGASTLISMAIRPLQLAAASAAHRRDRGIFWSLLAAGVAVVLGFGLASVLLKSHETWQVVWVLLIAFTVAGLAAHQLLPHLSHTLTLLAPLVVAMLAYGLVGMRYGAAANSLEAFFGDQLWEPALVMPVFYASAGVSGIALGIGWSQVLLMLHHQHLQQMGGYGQEAGAASQVSAVGIQSALATGAVGGPQDLPEAGSGSGSEAAGGDGEAPARPDLTPPTFNFMNFPNPTEDQDPPRSP